MLEKKQNITMYKKVFDLNNFALGLDASNGSHKIGFNVLPIHIKYH